MRIFYSDVKRRIGEVIVPRKLVGIDGNEIPTQPFLILREATYEEWYEDVRFNGGEPEGWPRSPYHYEAVTD